MELLHLLVITICAAQAPTQTETKTGAVASNTPAPRSTIERVSYGIGLKVGNNLKKDGLDVDLKQFVKGISDALSGAKPACTESEIREAMVAVQSELEAKRATRVKELGGKNAQEGSAFLAENGKKDGVKTTKSGLQYKVIKTGSGNTPKASDTVVTHYRGTLIDGTVFDSSFDRGEPATFPVGRVIRGWTEALQMMTVGSKWQLFIPADLAYGEQGAGDDIGPNAVLIFDIELIAIK
jgi:FKBP-type peptidyl-prolyl cis-trans isomerase FklB